MRPKRYNTKDTLGLIIAKAYEQGLNQIPDHLIPPYDKTKFAFTRSWPKKTLPDIQNVNPDKNPVIAYK